MKKPNNVASTSINLLVAPFAGNGGKMINCHASGKITVIATGPISSMPYIGGIGAFRCAVFNSTHNVSGILIQDGVSKILNIPLAGAQSEIY